MKNDNPDWEKLESDVVLRIRLLRGAWESTADKPIHSAMVRDLYVPCLRILAEFCIAVEVDGKV